MPIKLMYITNDPKVAEIAQSAGVDRIFVDMEYIGKADRQGGMDTVQSHHTDEDVKRLREVVTTSELMVRVNPWHEATDEYCSSEEEINAVIDAGADVVMLPYFKTADEVKKFIDVVNGRAITFLLLETDTAVDNLDEILDLHPDEIHIGINDLSLCKRKSFMFEMYSDGTVEYIAGKCKAHNIPFGVGGMASLGKGTLSSEYILGELYRLGANTVILSRSFCNVSKMDNYDDIKLIFDKGVKSIRAYERALQKHLDAGDTKLFEDNKRAMDIQIRVISGEINTK